MSENERMERAKRIRRMREGQRDEDGDDAVEESDDRATGAATNGDVPDATDDEAVAVAESASADGGTATAETEPTGEASADADVPESLGAAGSTRAELPSADEMEAAMEQTMAQAEAVTDDTDGDEAAAETDEDAPARPAGVAGERAETTQEPETRVLEFTLDDEQYCLDIEYIEEIVKHTAITRVPNTPDFVEGVVDLRGQITTILNPKVTIDKPNKEAGDLIVVFDAEAFEDQGHIGWVVDDVSQVSPVSDDEVNDPPMDDDHINGVIDREEDDGFVIWTTPDLALDEAE